MSSIIHINQRLAKVRKETVAGVEYLIAPAVLVTEGVLNGEYVSIGEIGAHYAAWNGAPFVIDHPQTKDGVNVSANDPQTLADTMIGRVYHTQLDDGALKGEVWIDAQLAAKVKRGKEVIDRLTNGKPLEVSTAYFRDREDGAGDFNGSKYAATARNLRPDHLAALLDVEGACSWADGCGMPRTNQDEVYMPYPNEHAQRLQNPGKYARIRRENDKFGAGIHAVWGVLEDGEVELQGIRFAKNKFTTSKAKTWLKDHDYPTGGFEPASKPVSQSVAAQALKSFAQKLGINVNVEEPQMEKLIEQIVENSDLTAEKLEGVNEDVLKTLLALFLAAKKKEKDDKDKEPEPDTKEKPKTQADDDKDEDKEPPATNEPCTELQELATAVKERGGVEAVFALIDGVQATEDGRKAKIVTELAANEACAFTDEQLKALDYGTLVTLRQSLTPADYAAQGGGARSDGELEVILPQMFE